MESNELDLDFAKAWDNNQGTFSSNLAKNIISFCEENNKNMRTALDICFGTANFLRVLNDAGFECYGTEIDKSMLDYSFQKYPNMKFSLAKNIYEIPIRRKFDLITCNHDMINYMESFDEWKLLFKNVAKHLEKDGLFIFDFYTKHKLKDWTETTFESSEWLDCLTSVKSGIYDKTVLNYTYYVNYRDYVVKTKSVVVECYFENQDILQALNKAGFKLTLFADSNLKRLESPDYAERIHVIASKR